MIASSRLLMLVIAGAIVGLNVSSPVRAQEPTQERTQSVLSSDDCHLQRRAISRRACYARLSDQMRVETADKN